MHPAVAGELDCLGTHATARLEHDAAGRISGVRVEQIDQSAGLVPQALAFSRLIAVNVRLTHRAIQQVQVFQASMVATPPRRRQQ